MYIHKVLLTLDFKQLRVKFKIYQLSYLQKAILFTNVNIKFIYWVAKLGILEFASCMWSWEPGQFDPIDTKLSANIFLSCTSAFLNIIIKFF